MNSPNTRFLNVEQLQGLTLVSQLVSADRACQCQRYQISTAQLCTELFRCLRNSCVQCEQNQNQIRHYGDLYSSLLTCFKTLMEKLERNDTGYTESDLLAVRCGLQFFGNFVVGNEDNKKLVWKSFNCDADNVFRRLLDFKDEKVVDYTAMVFYNVLSEENLTHLFQNKNVLATITHALINCFVTRKSHWSLLCLEKLCEQPSFWNTYSSDLLLSERVVLLDVIAEQMGPESPRLFKRFLEHLSVWFADNVLDVVKCVSEQNQETPLEITKSLSVLCLGSVLPEYQEVLQNVKLMEATINVLKAVHTLGKTQTNVFSPIQSLSARNTQSESLEENPAYGFKKDLVRLIGNMCSGSKECQAVVRELEGIPLLLDCCNMDAKNPYIIQWCTFAIHNVMENNPENQAVLASLTVSGQLVDSPLLSELGLCVRQDNDGKTTLQKL